SFGGSIQPTSNGANTKQKPSANTGDFHPDWGVSLSAGGTVGREMFPAKFNFDVNAAPDCDKDFVVYNTGLPGLAGTKGSQTGSFATSSTSLTGTVTVNGVALTASPGTAAFQTTTINANSVRISPAPDTITINGSS